MPTTGLFMRAHAHADHVAQQLQEQERAAREGGEDVDGDVQIGPQQRHADEGGEEHGADGPAHRHLPIGEEAVEQQRPEHPGPDGEPVEDGLDALEGLDRQGDDRDQAEEAEDRALDDLHGVGPVHPRQVAHRQRGDLVDEVVDPGDGVGRGPGGRRPGHRLPTPGAEPRLRREGLSAALAVHGPGL
jgi:hypothetical protein